MEFPGLWRGSRCRGLRKRRCASRFLFCFPVRSINETRRLRQLEEENGRLKKIVAQQALDLDALKVVLAKKW